MQRNCDSCPQENTHFRDEYHDTGMPGHRRVLIRMYACDAHAQYDGNGMWIPIFWAGEVKQ